MDNIAYGHAGQDLHSRSKIVPRTSTHSLVGKGQAGQGPSDRGRFMLGAVTYGD